jgi:starch phosphorylase
MERLKSICSHAEKIQVIYSGKAHPKDSEGKEQIRKVLEAAEILKEDIKVVFLENYDLALAKILIPGVDLWLNTPRKPLEASGTSGMKAAHNGVPSLSVLDGWWIEGCIEGLTGWAIESPKGQQSNDSIEAKSIYDKLQNKIIPVFYHDRQRWIHIMKHCIAINGSFFNSHRMMMQYALNAYMD